MLAKCQVTKRGRSAAEAQAPGVAADDVLALQGAAGPAKRNHQSRSLTMLTALISLLDLVNLENDPNQVLLTYLLIH